MNIQLALRLLECGLDMPKNEPSKTFGGVSFIAIPAVKTKLLVGMNWGPTKTAAQKEANKRANWQLVTVSPFDFTLSPLAAPNAAKDTE
jgi:hypothetical protein